ncbi:hypothetical protein J3R83DRAFT_3540 [Lanmaoa asiatica]|nr:hypothetical protein J3R83DRAFT_3540 [Lanmaoa asiatica]
MKHMAGVMALVPRSVQREGNNMNVLWRVLMPKQVLGYSDDSNPGEIDLHGLYVKEAVSYVDKSVQEARQRGDAEIRFIVGKSRRSCQGFSDTHQ